MKNGSILIITNQQETGKEISSKLKLLRDCDTIRIVSYIESISVLNTTQPSLILLHCAENDSAGIIKEIRAIHSLDRVPIVFITNTLSEDKLFFAFDNGIDDFFFLTDPDSIILMRILLTLQKSILYKQMGINNEILFSANIIDKQTGIYLKENAPIALRSFFSKSIEDNSENTVFVYLRPLSIENKPLNMTKIANVIKAIPRGNDIIAYGKASGFYLVLYNAGEEGASSVITRIRNVLADTCKIYACAADITASFEQMEPILYRSLKEQIASGKEFVYLKDLNPDKATEMYNIRDEQGKNFIDFKKEFLNEFEKIVAPVFYQIQTSNSEKFPESEINYYINENESRFKISQENLSSEIKISYPSYIKVIIDIKHIEKDKPTKNSRLIYDFDDFSQEKINMILEEMINDFANRLSLSVIQDGIK